MTEHVSIINENGGYVSKMLLNVLNIFCQMPKCFDMHQDIKNNNNNGWSNNWNTMHVKLKHSDKNHIKKLFRPIIQLYCRVELQSSCTGLSPPY